MTSRQWLRLAWASLVAVGIGMMACWLAMEAGVSIYWQAYRIWGP